MPKDRLIFAADGCEKKGYNFFIAFPNKLLAFSVLDLYFPGIVLYSVRNCTFRTAVYMVI